MRRGLLVALEGIDGAGTTTQAELLAQRISSEGARVEMTCEPSKGAIGRLIRSVLQGKGPALDRTSLALLFAADRCDHVQREVRPKLQQGVHVISDRFVYSSLAYQSLDLPLSWVAEINRNCPEPDLTIYLQVDAELAARRRAMRGGEQETFDADEDQRRIASTYDGLFGRQGTWVPAVDPAGSGKIRRWIQRDLEMDPALLGQTGRRPCWAVLDGSLGVQDLAEQIGRLYQDLSCSISGT